MVILYTIVSDRLPELLLRHLSESLQTENHSSCGLKDRKAMAQKLSNCPIIMVAK